jgi:hypothetical protein
MKYLNDISLILPVKEKELDTALSQWIVQFRNNLNTILKRQIKRDLRFKSYIPSDTTDIRLIEESAVTFILMDAPFMKIQGFSRLIRELTEKIETKKEIIIEEERIVKLILSESAREMASSFLKYFAAEDFFWKPVSDSPAVLVESNTIPYWSKLLDLSSIVLRIIGEEHGPEKRKTGDQNVVFLASTSPDMDPSRDILRRELIQHGYRVEPEIDLRVIPGETENYLLPVLEKAKIAVHLFGNDYGELFAGTDRSLPEFQMDIVTDYIDKLERRKATQSGNLIRLIWISPEISPIEEKQITFLEQLKQNIEKLRRTEIIQAPLELFKSILLKRLRQISQEEIRIAGKVKADKKTIYVIHDKRDEQAATVLIDKFLNAGINAVKIDFETDSANLINIHRENLVRCDAALIIYGHSNRFWLSSKMKDLLKAPGFGREQPLAAKGLMISGEDKLNGIPLPGDVIIMDKQEALDPFIEKLKK